MFDFTGKRAIVTGASRGIGGAIDLGFGRAGAAVSICARDAAAAGWARQEVESEVLRASADFGEGIAAFAEKRPPQWQGQ